MAYEVVLAAVTAVEGQSSFSLCSSPEGCTLGAAWVVWCVPLLQTRVPSGLEERDRCWLTGLVWGEAARGISRVANLAF